MRFSFVFGLGLVLLPSVGCFSEPTDALGEAETSGEATAGPTGEDAGPATASETGETTGGSTGVDGWSTGFGETSFASSTGWDLSSGTTGTSMDGEDGSSTGAGEESCGNGVREGAELCDDGPMPRLHAGACRPGCDGVIETRQLRLSASSTAGDLGPNPVATMDSLCPVGYRAMFAHGDTRRATVFGNEAEGAIDWPLHPYTAYINADGASIWVTDTVPLLGVRGGSSESLEHPIVGFDDNPPGALTGMNDDWTTSMGQDDDCLGWTSSAAVDLHTSGVPWIISAGAFLNNGGFSGCDQPSRAYCVEQ